MFLIGAEKLGLAPENCIVFEDAIAGVEAANRANMTSVGIGDAQTLSEADYNYNNLTELPENFFNEFLSEKV